MITRRLLLYLCLLNSLPARAQSPSKGQLNQELAWETVTHHPLSGVTVK